MKRPTMASLEADKAVLRLKLQQTDDALRLKLQQANERVQRLTDSLDERSHQLMMLAKSGEKFRDSFRKYLIIKAELAVSSEDFTRELSMDSMRKQADACWAPPPINLD